jgi:hypothetical protein
LRRSNVVAHGRGVLIAGFVIALVSPAGCGSSSSKSTTTQPNTTAPSNATTGQNATTQGGGATQDATAHVDLTVSGALKFHITGTKADCNGLGDGVDLSGADYPEVHDNLHIGSFNGVPEFKWLHGSVIYTNNSTVAGVTVTTHPFKAVLSGTKLDAAVPLGAPAQPGVTLSGTIACPS